MTLPENLPTEGLLSVSNEVLFEVDSFHAVVPFEASSDVLVPYV